MHIDDIARMLAVEGGRGDPRAPLAADEHGFVAAAPGEDGGRGSGFACISSWISVNRQRYEQQLPLAGGQSATSRPAEAVAETIESAEAADETVEA